MWDKGDTAWGMRHGYARKKMICSLRPFTVNCWVRRLESVRARMGMHSSLHRRACPPVETYGPRTGYVFIRTMDKLQAVGRGLFLVIIVCFCQCQCIMQTVGDVTQRPCA